MKFIKKFFIGLAITVSLIFLFIVGIVFLDYRNEKAAKDLYISGNVSSMSFEEAKYYINNVDTRRGVKDYMYLMLYKGVPEEIHLWSSNSSRYED